MEQVSASASAEKDEEGVYRGQKFSFLSLCGIALSTGESWVALGNGLTLALDNGGSVGVLYGFIAASVCYWIVAASIAELASSMPTTATVFHWARVTGGPRFSWLAGWWSFAAWQLGVASLLSFMSLQMLGIYGVLHPNFEARDWQLFAAYVACNWTMCLIVLFGDKWLAKVESFGLLLTTSGWLISILICAIMPSVSGRGYASSEAVWTGWQNLTGWSSNGFVFCLGMLNAAVACCAPDIPSHLAEEIPNAKRNVPLAILAQYVASFITGLAFLITLFYAVPDLQAVTTRRSIFPLSLLYIQATSRPAAVGLICLCLLNTAIGVLGVFAVAGRQVWALARADATPFAKFFTHLDPATKAPYRAIAFVGVLSTALGCLYLASEHAFNALTGSFVVFLSLAYLAAILPHLLSGRKRVPRGPFWMGPVGWVVNAASVVYLVAFAVIFCIPSIMPVTGANMQYTSVIVIMWTLLATLWYLVKRKGVEKGGG